MRLGIHSSFIILIFLLQINYAKAQNRDKVILLKEGLTLDQKLTATEQHQYKINLKNGEALLVEIVQESIDVVIDIVNSLPTHSLSPKWHQQTNEQQEKSYEQWISMLPDGHNNNNK